MIEYMFHLEILKPGLRSQASNQYDAQAGFYQTLMDISDSKLGFDSSYRCGIRKERLRARPSRRFEAVYKLSLLEEVVRQGFQKVLISSLREVFVLLWRLLFWVFTVSKA